jgi:hypothetical protein
MHPPLVLLAAIEAHGSLDHLQREMPPNLFTLIFRHQSTGCPFFFKNLIANALKPSKIPEYLDRFLK